MLQTAEYLTAQTFTIGINCGFIEILKKKGQRWRLSPNSEPEVNNYLKLLHTPPIGRQVRGCENINLTKCYQLLYQDMLKAHHQMGHPYDKGHTIAYCKHFETALLLYLIRFFLFF